jgi:hypothetical protein
MPYIITVDTISQRWPNVCPFCVGAWSHWRIGWQRIRDRAPDDFAMMAAAGVFNTVAFLAPTKALQVANLV